MSPSQCRAKCQKTHQFYTNGLANHLENRRKVIRESKAAGTGELISSAPCSLLYDEDNYLVISFVSSASQFLTSSESSGASF